jgi:hypothetical protein
MNMASNIMVENSTAPFQECEFTRAAVTHLGQLVCVTDKDEENGLELFCYVNCNSQSSDLLKQCRGVVFHGEEIVTRAFPYTDEYNNTNLNELQSVIQPDFSKCEFYDAHEGAIVRMFYFKNRWYICTHRKLDAFRSKWSSKHSFGASFKLALETEVENNSQLSAVLPTTSENVLERFQSILDTTKQYMFLVRHNVENRIVCNPPVRPKLYHVGTFVNGRIAKFIINQIKIP